jgi:two-component system sensor histidine kinase/response regulator
VMDGLEATKEIKRMAREKGHNTIIIAISASAFDQDVENILSAGCDDFVSKPFKESEIYEKMHNLLGFHYVYEDVGIKNKPVSIQEKADIFESIQELTSEWRASMKKAVSLLDYDKMCILTTQIRDQHTILADTLQRKIDKYDYETLLKVFQKK